jgi:hypothetical protein
MNSTDPGSIFAKLQRSAFAGSVAVSETVVCAKDGLTVSGFPK